MPEAVHLSSRADSPLCSRKGSTAPPFALGCAHGLSPRTRRVSLRPVLEEVEDALVLEQPGDEVEVGLAVLHAVLARRVARRSAPPGRRSRPPRAPARRSRGPTVLEDPAPEDLPSRQNAGTIVAAGGAGRSFGYFPVPAADPGDDAVDEPVLVAEVHASQAGSPTGPAGSTSSRGDVVTSARRARRAAPALEAEDAQLAGGEGPGLELEWDGPVALRRRRDGHRSPVAAHRGGAIEAQTRSREG